MDGILIFLLAVVLIVCVVHGINLYNRLNPLREELHEAEGNIEVCMQKSISLTQKLVDLAARYGLHEKDIHLQISLDRRKAQESIYQRSLQALTQISGFADTFPALKADQTYLRLMSDLERISGEIQHKYEHYNRQAKVYNTARTSFPAVLTSGMLGFGKASYLNPARWYPTNGQKVVTT